MRRLAGVAALAAAVLVLSAQPARAQTPPTVRVAGTTAMAEAGQCFTEPTFTAGSFTLERDDPTGALDVTFHISGGPTDLDSDAAAGADHSAGFADGQSQVTVAVHPALGGGEATVALVDGPAYDLGDPSSATIAKSVSSPSCVAPSTVPRSLARTGTHSSTFGLTLTALGLILVGLAMKRVANARLR